MCGSGASTRGPRASDCEVRRGADPVARRRLFGARRQAVGSSRGAVATGTGAARNCGRPAAGVVGGRRRCFRGQIGPPRWGRSDVRADGPAGHGGGPRSRWHAPRADATGTVAQSLAELARQLGTASPDTLSAVFSRWSEVVGESVAAHSRPEKLDGEALLVSVDPPAWASHLRSLAPRVRDHRPTASGSRAVPRRFIRVKLPKKASD